MALNVKTEFELECPPATAWAFLTDAQRAVPCFPGAELGEAQADGSHVGSFGVKLGPMTLKFAGRFTVIPVDAELGTLNVRASGQDQKGRGSATADVQCTLAPADGRTRIAVNSNVELTGSIAQFGRAAGMIEVLSKQLLLRFASNVQKALASEAAERTAAPATVPSPLPLPHASQQAPGGEPAAAPAPAQTPAAPMAAPAPGQTAGTVSPPPAGAGPPISPGFWGKLRRWLTRWVLRR